MEIRTTFTIGGVLGRAKSITRPHMLEFFAVVFVPSLLGDLLSDAIEDTVVPDVGGQSVDDLTDLVRAVIEMLPNLLCVAGTVILAGIVVDAAAADARGVASTFAASLRSGVALFPMTFAIAVLSALTLAAGGVFLIVPGVMVVTAWSLAIPVFVAERSRFVDAFRRSRTLTMGHRWPIFGLIVLGFAAAYASDILENDVSDWLDLGDIGTWTFGVAGASLQAVLGVLASAIWAAAYLEFRWIQEGEVSAATLAAFD